MKIGIITINDTYDEPNYGNVLQLYALNRYLSQTYPEHQFITLEYNGTHRFKGKNSHFSKNLIIYVKEIRLLMKKFINSRNQLIKSRKQQFRAFVDKNGIITKQVSFDKFPQDFGAVIVGSDVVWEQKSGIVDRYYFLDSFIPSGVLKFSYAASFGSPEIPKNNYNLLQQLLRDFEGVSVRESSAVANLKKIGINAMHVSDPTLLLCVDEWRKIEKKCELIPQGKKYCFIYMLGLNQDSVNTIERYVKSKDLLPVTISMPNGWSNYEFPSFSGVILEKCSPSQFIWLVDNAALILTDSFHGTVFSAIFKKPFAVIDRADSNKLNDRIDDFLRSSGAEQVHMSLKELELLKELPLQNISFENLSNSGKMFLDNVVKSGLPSKLPVDVTRI